MKQRRLNLSIDDKKNDDHDDLEAASIVNHHAQQPRPQQSTTPTTSSPRSSHRRRRGRPRPAPREEAPKQQKEKAQSGLHTHINNHEDVFFRRVIWCFVLMCPVSFVFSLFLSAYILERLDSSEQTASKIMAMDPGLLPQQMGRWVPDKVRGMMPSFWWVDEIDMRELTYTLPFDNQPGGVWTQGWDLDPVPIGSGHETLQVFVVPHSHCDPGWLKTFDQYFQTQTKNILTTVVEALTAHPNRRFIWAEISYLEWWWREQGYEQQQALKRLLDNGQFELVTGGWVQPDEANSQMYALEVQLQEGHDWIRNTLGPEHIPSYGWSIDPFGYSPSMAYLLSKYNFTGMVIQRVHYAVKKELARRQHLEFKWRQTWDKQGEYDIWTHVLPFFSYDVPHSCGPDPSVCCQFDFARKPVGRGLRSGACPWKKPPKVITDANIEERAKTLLDQYRKKAALYRSRAVLVPLGDDFRFQTKKEAEDQFTNYQRIFDYINKNIHGVHVQFGTLKEYFNAAEKSKINLPLLKGSFFTYSDVNEDYWSGYFTSRAFDKALDRQLERSLYTAERLGANKDELQEARRALSLFQHHDGVTGTATVHVVHDYAYRMKKAIELSQDASLKHLRLEFAPLVQTLDENIQPCLLSGSPRGLAQNLCGDEGAVVAYNPSSIGQTCNSTLVPPKQAALVNLPCEITGPAKGSAAKFIFDDTTGLMLEPFREEWLGWQVKRGGAYLFYPDRLLQFYRKKTLVSEHGGFKVSAPGWNRTVVEQPVPAELADQVTVVDFVYENHLETDNEEWFVRFSTDIKNQGFFHTDLNGFNFDTHRFRRDLPIQSQVFPMPTHASIQDAHYRLTVLSEHSQGTASLRDGSIDVWLDRRLAQDDGRGLGQGVMDNVPIRTRLRVILEKNGFDFKANDFKVTDVVRRYWDELQHPLEFFGVHTKELDKSLVVADPAKHEQERLDRRTWREKIRNGGLDHGVGSESILSRGGRIHDPFTDDKVRASMPEKALDHAAVETFHMAEDERTKPDGDVPFVFMVFNRLHYFNQSIESLRQSDFPRDRVPVIISHDGHVPDIVHYVETMKSDFQVIQLFHPFSCYDHQSSFPGNDEKLNEGYRGDKAGNSRTAQVTCAKHHFTWLLNEVFSMDITTSNGPVENFAFLEEDYVIGPSIYEAITVGLHVLVQAETTVPGGIIGLELDPTLAGNRREQKNLGDYWYAMQFATGPMTLGRNIYRKMKANAESYCTFDDYNWDWSMVRLAFLDKLPHVVLGPARMLVKHIGLEGMHTDQIKKGKKKQHDIELQPWVGRRFANRKVAKKKAPGYGGWAHPVDQEHCRNLFSGTANVTHLYEYWQEYNLHVS